MEMPDIGSLNRRVRIYVMEARPDRDQGFTSHPVFRDEVWGKLEVVGSVMYFGTKQVESGVSHRVYVRRYEGRTRPQDLYGITELEIDGVRYRVRRVADVAGACRFTVMDVEEIDDAGGRSSRPRLSDY